MPQDSVGKPTFERVEGSGAEALTDEQWEEARRRAFVIRQLCKGDANTGFEVAWASQELRLSRASVYRLIKAWRVSGGSLLSLAPSSPNGGRGSTRLSPAVEHIVDNEIRRSYLSRQKPSVTILMREIRKACRLDGHRPPALNTVRARIQKLDPEAVASARQGEAAKRRLQAAGGGGVRAGAPLDVVQIDHTKIDLIVVEPQSREPIGRPFLTLAIDVYSRAILGMLVTLEPPSATSVGLCLAHCAAEKSAWIERLGIETTWPVHGRPRMIHVDNGAEFHSEALRRGCDSHGIELSYRPPGQPHFGGVVERVIGTTMKMIKELPGATFSNIVERGEYQSEKHAALTLKELERWIALAIAGPYHNSVHGSLMEPPLSRWRSGLGADEPAIGDDRAFLVDFLPVEKRRIQREGFTLDHITYFSNALKPWIAARDRLDRFLIRRDPRDLSRIWVLEPGGGTYLEVPYRTISNPAVTLWEHRAAVKALRERGRAEVDEAAIFNAIEQMRQITEAAASKKKSARRELARRNAAGPVSAPESELDFPEFPEPAASGTAFEDFEQW